MGARAVRSRASLHRVRALVTGASGYIGSRLVAALLAAGHDVVATGRQPSRLTPFDWSPRVRTVAMDVADAGSCARALTEHGPIHVAYYLVHAIGSDDFRARDRAGAVAFAVAARAAGVRRVVYLGGLVPQGEELSEHLASRAEVGEVLAEHGPELVWLRAAVVLGAGSASYEVVRYLADWLPAVPTPPWMSTLVQPVAVDDVLRWSVAAADPELVPAGRYDLGGPEQMPYRELIRHYTRAAGLRRLLLPTPPAPTALAAWVVARLTPLPQPMVAELVLSLTNTMVTAEDRIARLVPGPLTTVDDALRRARVASHVRRDRLPGVSANPDPLRLCRTDADWAHRR